MASLLPKQKVELLLLSIPLSIISSRAAISTHGKVIPSSSSPVLLGGEETVGVGAEDEREKGIRCDAGISPEEMLCLRIKPVRIFDGFDLPDGCEPAGADASSLTEEDDSLEEAASTPPTTANNCKNSQR
jgi:hypothetical protein